MIKIKVSESKVGVYVPTKVEEIKAKDLANITANIKVAKHYAVIALCFNTKLYDFAMTIDKGKQENIGVVPVLAKLHLDNIDECDFKVGDKIIVDRSSIERGFNVMGRTIIQSNNFANYIRNNKEYLKAILAKDIDVIPQDVLNSNIVLLEFKIVPLNSIVASITDDVVTDIFVEEVKVE